MPTYLIGSVAVKFPYQAYDCQLVYMGKVIEALQQGRNALLESPTGTGKTLCLLCAALAWRASLGPAKPEVGVDVTTGTPVFRSSGEATKKLPTIIYSSRTHSQLQQVVRELKATEYRPKMVVLGSRDQMCINEQVSQSLRGTALNSACRTLVRAHSCPHHSKASEYLRSNPEMGREPIDIEDMVKLGKTHGPCPYYLSRELHESADLVFVPYNYIIDKDNRKSLKGIAWEGAILIVDEAHNLEEQCADQASQDLPAALLAACVGEAKRCVELALTQRAGDGASEASTDPDTFAVLKGLLLAMEKEIAEVPIADPQKGLSQAGGFIHELLARVNITHATVPMLLDAIEHAALLLSDEASSAGIGGGGDGRAQFRLQTLHSALRVIFADGGPSYTASFRTHISEGSGRSSRAKAGRTLSWWCFDPGVTMAALLRLGLRSVVLTSGTLSPMDSFAHELHMPFEVRLENPHVIGAKQIWVGVLPVGPSGRQLNSSFKTRDSLDYKLELGNSIVNFARIVPDGLLVFFPSYGVMESSLQAWQGPAPGGGMSVWERILKQKQAVVEPRDSALFAAANQDYVAKLSDTSSGGAIFFAVCRGKVSEGLDFADKAGRAVVITGLPYPMMMDPKVRLKREYLDESVSAAAGGRSHKGLAGGEWYVQQSARAVNQAVGRVIRHRHDFGAIILCDERFKQPQAQKLMSLWLRPYIKNYSKFGDAAFSLTKFFREKGAHGMPGALPAGTSSSLQPGTSLPQTLPGHKALELEGASGPSPAGSITPVDNFLGGLLSASSAATPAGRLSDSHIGVSTGQVSRPERGILSVLASHSSGSAVHGDLGGGSKRQSVSEVLLAARQLAAQQQQRGHQLSETSVLPANGVQRAMPAGSPLAAPVVVGPAHVLEALRKKASLGSALGARPSQDRSLTPGAISAQNATAGSPSGPEHASSEGPRPSGPGPRERGVDEDEAARLKRARLEGLPPPVLPPGKGGKKQAKEYLAEVKCQLSIGEHGTFLKAMRTFQEGSLPAAAMVDVVAGIFHAPERFPLLQGFAKFLRDEHRPLLDPILANHAGYLHARDFSLAKEGRVARSGSAKDRSAATGPGSVDPPPEETSASLPDGVTKSEARQECSVCRRPPEAPWSAPCGHVCCYGCWNGPLQTCPTCSAPVRRRDLKKVFFA